MFDTYKMQEQICRELEKKSESGLKSTADLDTIWKLIDAYKNLLKVDMLQDASEGEYSERRKRDSRGRYARDGAGNYSYEGDSSYNRGEYGRGGYSEARGEYMDAKHSYRSTRSPEHKRDMSVSLEDCKHKLKEELQQMLSGADTREEREQIKEMIREIGSLA